MKFLGGLVFTLCLFVLLISAKSTDVHYFSKKANYAVKVSGLEIDPYPISRGKNTTFQIAAATNEAIYGGKLVIHVLYFGFHIHSEDRDLCAEMSCPVSIGDFVVSHSQELSGIMPMVDEHKKQLMCITFEFSIVS
ncbi:UNVERIFIED_CONTAM: hypothetical protein Sangu_2616100 [Sesamum angustifolium]|uniref:MD-2-related lipid-recognition domain-containing protein n=1 Tax=Sesamum angustifolium TaxID=2727405 RepID=A0AAW2J788_9LAMI